MLTSRAKRRFTPDEARRIEARVREQTAKDSGRPINHPQYPRNPAPLLPDDEFEKRRVQKLTIELPWPTSTNHIYKPASYPPGTKAKVLTDEHKSFRSNVIIKVWQMGRPWIAGKLRCNLTYYESAVNTLDIDNGQKATFDALAHAQVFDNDKQIRELHVDYGPVVEVAFIIVTLESITPGGTHGNAKDREQGNQDPRKDSTQGRRSEGLRARAHVAEEPSQPRRDHRAPAPAGESR